MLVDFAKKLLNNSSVFFFCKDNPNRDQNHQTCLDVMARCSHALVIPKRHVANYFELTNHEREAMNVMLQYVKRKIDERFHPDGYNVGINVNEAAGQSVFHIHMHLITRYIGDVKNPKGGVRGVIPSKQKYSTEEKPYSKNESATLARRGQKWDKNDDERLWDLLMRKVSINELALIFQRSKKSIIYRLRKLQKEKPMQEDIFTEYYKVFGERISE